VEQPSVPAGDVHLITKPTAPTWERSQIPRCFAPHFLFARPPSEDHQTHKRQRPWYGAKHHLLPSSIYLPSRKNDAFPHVLECCHDSKAASNLLTSLSPQCYYCECDVSNGEQIPTARCPSAILRTFPHREPRQPLDCSSCWRDRLRAASHRRKAAKDVAHCGVPILGRRG